RRELSREDVQARVVCEPDRKRAQGARVPSQADPQADQLVPGLVLPHLGSDAKGKAHFAPDQAGLAEEQLHLSISPATSGPSPPTPSANTRRSPKMSPSDPPSRINEPSVNRKALLTHCSPARPPSRLCWIDGSATLTTLLSRIAMLDPRIVATSVKRFLDADRL